jgi:hypothetical protein
MKAAVVTTFNAPPRYQDFPDPAAAGDDEIVVKSDVDMVIDYLWGEPTASAMAAVITGRADRGKPREYLAELPALAETITAGRLDVDAQTMPLADVEQAWAAIHATHRIVLAPQP